MNLVPTQTAAAGRLMDRPVALWILLGGVIALQLIFSAQAARTGQLVYVFLPLAGMVGAVVLLQPHWGLALLVSTWFLGVPLSSSMGVYPADVVLILTAGGYIIRQLTGGLPLFVRTPIDRWLLIFIIALTISWLLSVNKVAGFVNWAHHLQVLLFYFVVAGLARESDIRRCLRIFIGLCLILSAWNVRTFLLAAGDIRAFGPAGIRMTGFLSLAATYATARFLLAAQRRDRWMWAGIILVFVIGQLVNQSRGGMLQLVTGVLFAAFLAARWARVHGRRGVRRRMVFLGIALAVAGLALLVLYTPMVAHVIERYATRQGNELATANMRLFLWKTAVHLFLEYPLFGVGLAQEDVWVHVFPGMRFDPLFLVTRGLDFHNSMLGYLASTGVVGSIALVALLVRTILMGMPLALRLRDQEQAAQALGIWAMVIVIATRYLYEGHLFYSISGICAATFFAFLAILHRRAHSSFFMPDHV